MAIADEKLVEEVAKVVTREVTAGPQIGWSRAAANGLLADTALIKRMAEGVGFEVKEKPLGFVLREGAADWFVIDSANVGRYVASINKLPDPEIARQTAQFHADKLNQKERAADGK